MTSGYAGVGDRVQTVLDAVMAIGSDLDAMEPPEK